MRLGKLRPKPITPGKEERIINIPPNLKRIYDLSSVKLSCNEKSNGSSRSSPSVESENGDDTSPKKESKKEEGDVIYRKDPKV